jgi:MFS family permease
MGFAWKYLVESRVQSKPAAGTKATSSKTAVLRVLSHPAEPAPRLIWIYAIAMGAFQGFTALLALFLNAKFNVTASTIGYFFMYVGVISVLTRALILGKMVDRFGEERLARVGTMLLAAGALGTALAPSLPWLALATAFIPLGTAFTFPCVTAMLSRVIAPHERGLYLGVQQTFGGVARVAFPIFAGFLFDSLGHQWPFYASAALVAATIPLTAGLEAAKQKAAPAA